MTNVTIIYIPGLGGKYDAFRAFALKLWNRSGRRLVFLPMNWTDKNETLEQKKQRIRSEIARAEGQVVLIGESAGAAIGLLMAQENQSLGYIAYCGKIGGAKSTGEHYYKIVPTFHELLPEADHIREQLTDEQKSRMRIVRAYRDLFLSDRDTSLLGVKKITLPSIGHLSTIVLGITILRYGLLRAVKQLTS